MTIATELFNGTTFSHNESNIFEFKETFCIKAFHQYLEIICGFLNTGGGHLIFGIKDNLTLTGLSVNQKDLDNFILRLDGIVHQSQILRIHYDANINLSKSSVVTYINPSHISIEQITNDRNKRFLSIQLMPDADENIKYQLVNGMVYYRLGASNYCEKTDKLYKQAEYEAACKDYQNNAKKINKTNIDLFQQSLKEKNNHIDIKNKQLAGQSETIHAQKNSWKYILSI